MVKTAKFVAIEKDNADSIGERTRCHSVYVYRRDLPSPFIPFSSDRSQSTVHGYPSASG